MSGDLFAGDGWQQFDLPDAAVALLARADIGAPASAQAPADPEGWLHWLIDNTPWRSEEIQLFGKRYLQPRLTAWYGDPGCAYRYSGLDMALLDWNPTLLRLRQRIEALCGSPFNSVLLNYYRDGNDSMGMHSDDEPELGPQPVIASLSLGATRPIQFKHRTRRELAAFRLPLTSGSLLVMRGATQANWKHGVAKQRRVTGPRVNLTFRRIVRTV